MSKNFDTPKKGADTQPDGSAKAQVDEVVDDSEISIEDIDKHLADTMWIKPLNCTDTDANKIEIPKKHKDNYIGKGWEVL